MKKLMISNEIPTSNYIIANNIDFNQISQLKFPVVIKPFDNNGSKGVHRIDSIDDIETAIKKASKYTNTGIIAEEYVKGDEYSIEAFLYEEDVEILLVTQLLKISNNGSFTIVKCLYEHDFIIEKKILLKIGKVFKLKNVPIIIQLIATKEHISIIEFSARTGGGSKHHLISAITGVNIFENLLDITFGIRPAIFKKQYYKYGAINYIYVKKGNFKGLINFDFLKHQGTISDYFFYKMPGSNITDAVYSSDRPVGYLVLAESKEDLINRINKIDMEVAVLDQSHNDIMIHNLHT
jgi:biotin carboxylase